MSEHHSQRSSSELQSISECSDQALIQGHATAMQDFDASRRSSESGGQGHAKSLDYSDRQTARGHPRSCEAAGAAKKAILSAMKGSGRDDLHFLGDNIASWAELARDAGEGTYFCESLEDHLRITTLPAPEGSGRWGIGAAAGGGLVSRFDAADELCVRSVKATFSFRDSLSAISHDYHEIPYDRPHVIPYCAR